jgi:dTDP-4-amino-4,6-dideoxygalactose transaminase
VSSGTAALEIIFRTLDVVGREVIVPTNTFFATAAAVIHAGGTPRFVDVSPSSLCASLDAIDGAIGEQTAAVVVVHIGGAVAPDIVAIAELCKRRGVVLIEDAAHAHGASLEGRPAGSFGEAAAFSFYPTKVITSGEGGMIVTTHEAWRDEARIYRDQGKAGFLGGDHVRMGYAWRMSEPDAAIGLVHLRRLDDFLVERRGVAAAYDRGLASMAGVTAVPTDIVGGNYYKYLALLDEGIDRDELKAALRAEFGVGLSGEVYASPLHAQPVFAPWSAGSYPVADDVCARHICLPVHSDMTTSEVEHVLSSLDATLTNMTSSS